MKLADIVALKIMKQIKKGAGTGDAWSCGSTHFMALWHFWPCWAEELDAKGITTGEKELVVKKVVLAIAPLYDESNQTAANLASFIRGTYEWYRLKIPNDVVSLTFDNTNVNPAVCGILKVPMVGAYCHRFNLAAKKEHERLEEHAQIMDQIHAVMKKAMTSNIRGLMHQEDIRDTPIIQQKTRWSSESMMCLRYSDLHAKFYESDELREVFDDEDVIIEHEDLKNSKPSKKAKATLLDDSQRAIHDNIIVPKLKVMNKTMKMLQTRKDMVLDIRIANNLFNNCLETLNDKEIVVGSEFIRRLSPTHDLVKYQDFEMGCHLILENQESLMTDRQKRACRQLLRKNWQHLYPDNPEEQDDADEIEDVGPKSPSQIIREGKRAQKRRKVDRESEYVDPIFIPATTVDSESLFSLASNNVMTQARRHMQPRLFEAIIVLSVNCEWWDLFTVDEMVRGKFDEALEEKDKPDEDAEEDADDM